MDSVGQELCLSRSY